MTVRLLPAYRRGGFNPYAMSGEPLTEYAALIRSPRSGRGRYEARWHRTRCATRRAANGPIPEEIVVTAWCGTTVFASEAFKTDDALDGFPVCGSCEGRALGAGLPGVVALLDVTKTGVVFEPNEVTKFRPPKVCPGRTLEPLPLDRASVDVGVCAACGIVAPIKRPSRYPIVNDWCVKDHQPSADLVAPCPTHAWDDLTHRGGVTMCSCKAEASPVAEPGCSGGRYCVAAVHAEGCDATEAETC